MGQEVSRRSRVRGALMGAALGDALSEATPGCIRQLVQGDDRGVAGFTEPGGITERVGLLLFSVAACMEGSIRAAAKGIAAPPEDYVLDGYRRWLHVRGLPWSVLDIGEHQRYHCWLMEEAVLYSERSSFGYGIGGELSHEQFYGPDPDPDEVLHTSVGLQAAAPMALALVDPLGCPSTELFARAGELSGFDEEEDAAAIGLVAVVLRHLLAGRDLAEVLSELADELGCAAAAIVERALGPVDVDGDPADRNPWSTVDAVVLALRAALADGAFDATLVEVVNAAGIDSDAPTLFGMVAGAIQGIDAIDPGWVDGLRCAHVVTELADDVADWSALAGGEGGPGAIAWPRTALWTKYEGTQFLPGASQLWEVDLGTPGRPRLVAWNPVGGPRRGLGDDLPDEPFAGESVGVVDLPMGEGLARDEGVRLLRGPEDHLFLYVSPFGPHPGLDYVLETLVTGRLGASLVGMSGCDDARSLLAWCMGSSDAQRAFGGMSAFGQMGTFRDVAGGFDDAMQDDLGALGLRADGGRTRRNPRDRREEA
ncbi:MAG: ADP-ribosylglycohydrolase family protein [Planctomycetia bacterium]